jgi:hypothetical protein
MTQTICAAGLDGTSSPTAAFIVFWAELTFRRSNTIFSTAANLNYF